MLRKRYCKPKILVGNFIHQTIQVGANVTLTLADFPASAKLGKMRLQITRDGTARNNCMGQLVVDHLKLIVHGPVHLQ